MSFRKFFDMAGIGTSALKKGNLSGKEKPSLKNIARLGKDSAVKQPFQHVIQHIETTKKKNKKKTEDLKISSNSKKTKTKSNKGTSYSGPGDTNL
jgi:hypothetical protein